MRLDKKVVGKRIRFVLAIELGKVVLQEVPEEDILGFLGSCTRA